MSYINEQKIINRADNNLMDVIRHYCPGIEFTETGKVYKAKCPFFSEEDTRFYIWPAKRCWICYGGIEARGGALQFIMRYKGCDRRQALAELEGMYNPASTGFSAKTEKVSPVHEYVFEENDSFSAEELSLLGNLKRNYKKEDGSFEERDTITSDDLKRVFPIRSLKSFTRPAKEGDDFSWRICSTEEFPILYWYYTRPDGSVWGKIYQPKASKGNRFSYFGVKEKNFIFGDKQTTDLLAKAKRGEAIDSEKRIKELVIVSGGSDAINTYFNGGFNVCWLNSETDILDWYKEFQLRKIAKSITVLYDLDDTGRKFAYRMALRYMNIKLAMLPEEMYRQTNGACKDVKDFFIKWNTGDNSAARRQDYFYMDKFKRFDHLVTNALPLKFWMDKVKEVKDGDTTEEKVVGVEIDNEQMFRFLTAYGVHRYAYSDDEYKFVRINDNIVEEIGEKKISATVNQILREFITNSPTYFDKRLLNTINRSNQVKGQSLQNISEIKLDFSYDCKDQDFLFFRNGALRITKNDMEMIPLESLPFNLYKDKIIDADFKPEKEDLFYIEYTEKYITSNETDTFPQLDRFSLKKDWDGLSYAQFVYNTGEIFWREKELGIELTEEQEKEPILNFVSKVCALGYACRKYKEMSRAYLLMCVEDENNKNGEHNGGVGKSLFYYPIQCVRSLCYRDGQMIDPKKDADLLYQNVEPGKTDVVWFDDLQRGFPLQMMFNTVTGNMTVRKRFKDIVVIPFEDSPITIVNSNHKPADIDRSKRRRAWFLTFSSYYHPEDPNRGIPARKPDMEFGKNIVTDYTPEEMNKLYHFFAQCIQTYMRINERVLPGMDRVEKGMLINGVSQNVFDWMNDYFDEYEETQNRLNVPIWRNGIFEEFKQVYSRTVQDRITVGTLKEKLQKFCDYKHWVLNPSELYRSQSERERGEYRKGREGKDDFFWYIQTRDLDEETITAFQEKTVEPIDLSPEQTSYAFPQTHREPRPANAPKQYSIEEEKKDLLF